MRMIYISRIVFLVLFIITSHNQIAQSQSLPLGGWIEHVSFRSTIAVVETSSDIVASSEKGLIIVDKATRSEIQTLTKSRGLSDIDIKHLAWYDTENVLIIGYRNGNLDLVSSDYSVRNISDIARSTIYLGRRRLNKIRIYKDRAYICMGFGIVVFDISRRLFPETLIIGPNGSQIEVFDIAFDEAEGRVYAATELGVFSASLGSSLSFFMNWTPEPGMITRPFNHVVNWQGKIVANRLTGTNDDSLFIRENGTWTWMNDVFISKNFDVEVCGEELIITNDFSVVSYRPNRMMRLNIEPGNVFNPRFKPNAAIMARDGNWYWIASEFEGLYGYLLSEKWLFTFLPDGPFDEDVFRMRYHNGRLWVAPGALNSVWGPTFNNKGIYYYDNFNWQHITPSQLNNRTDILSITPSPSEPGTIYATAWGQGIIQITNGQYITTFNSANTDGALSPVSGAPDQVRPFDVVFDSKGNLWTATSLSERPLARRTPTGQWINYPMGTVAGTTTNIGRMLVTREDQIWMMLQNRGIGIARLDDNGNLQLRQLTQLEGSGNLPSADVRSFAEDLDGAVWIGTSAGVAVLYTPRFVFEPNRNYDVRRITFEEDGIVQALLAQEVVTAIAVDGANKKWFGTQNSGIFYTSADGREQIFNFNRNNSPLPSNNILDIEIDRKTGLVYIATDRGIVAYQGAATEGNTTFSDVFAYPNPVRPDYDGPVFIRGLVTGAYVKITDVAGNLVFETRAEGGQAIWDGKDFKGRRVQSGVYLAYMSDELGFNTYVAKILIIR